MRFIVKKNDPDKDFKIKEIKQHFPPNVNIITLEEKLNVNSVYNSSENIYFDSSIELPNEIEKYKNSFIIEFKGKSWKVLAK